MALKLMQQMTEDQLVDALCQQLDERALHRLMRKLDAKARNLDLTRTLKDYFDARINGAVGRYFREPPGACA